MAKTSATRPQNGPHKILKRQTYRGPGPRQMQIIDPAKEAEPVVLSFGHMSDADYRGMIALKFIAPEEK